MAWAVYEPVAWPLSAQRPVGTSIATSACGRWRWRCRSRASIASPDARRWPMPSRASIQRAALLGSGLASSRGMPSHRAWRRWAALSGLWRSNGLQMAVEMPARCSSRAITSPSPPLWPGPTSTSAPWRPSRSPCCSSSSRLTARAAFSIRASTGRPLAKSCSSSAAIWALLTSRWQLLRAGQGATADGSPNPVQSSGFHDGSTPASCLPFACSSGFFRFCAACFDAGWPGRFTAAAGLARGASRRGGPLRRR